MTPALGIALGKGNPGGFFSDTIVNPASVLFAAQLLPTVVAADADPPKISATIITLPTATAMLRLRICLPFRCPARGRDLQPWTGAAYGLGRRLNRNLNRSYPTSK